MKLPFSPTKSSLLCVRCVPNDQRRELSCSQRQTPARIHFGRLGRLVISRVRTQVTVDVDPTLYSQAYLDEERRALGEDRYKREFLGIPAGGQASPFTWEQFDRATQAPVHPATWKGFRPTIIAHDVGHTKDRSTAVVGGKNIYAPGLSLLKEFHELPQGLYGSDRAEALARIDRLYDYKSLIFVDLSFDPTYAEVLVERLGPERVIGLKITSSGDGMSFEPRRVKNSAIRVYPVGRSYLFDLLHRELHDNKVRILDGPTSRRAYEQLTMLEMDYRQNGTIYAVYQGDTMISPSHAPSWCGLRSIRILNSGRGCWSLV